MRRSVVGIQLASALALLAGCAGGESAEPSASQFELRLVEREGLGSAQAACVSGYVFAEYPPDVIGQLYDAGLEAVSMAQWNSYGHSMLACSLAAELGVASPAPDGDDP